MLAIPPLTPQQCNQLGNNDIGHPDCGTATATWLSNYILDILTPFIYFAAILTFGVLLYGGIKYIMSTGQEEEARKAKLIIIYAIIGLLLIGLAGLIVNTTLNTPDNPPDPYEPDQQPLLEVP